MRLIALVIVAVAVYQILSFAKYNWDKGNKTAAAGSLFLALLTLLVPIMTMLMLG
jgi:heme/copper-type cytochrome/quinol oxidase subunit 2